MLTFQYMVTLFAESSQSMKINRPAACIFNCCQLCKLFKRLFMAELVVNSLFSDNQGRRWGSHQPPLFTSFSVHLARLLNHSGHFFFWTASVILDYQANISTTTTTIVASLCMLHYTLQTLNCVHFCDSAALFLLHNSTFTIAVDAPFPFLSSSLFIPLSHSDSSSFFPPSLPGHRFRAWSDIHVMGE